MRPEADLAETLSATPPVEQPASNPPPQAEQPINVPAFLHSCLRGRYPAVILLGLLAGAAVAAVGWRFSEPSYRSEGLIQIKYVEPPVDPNFSDNGSTPFDVFMQSQQTLITSRRVVDKALQEPAWFALRRPLTPQLLNGFATNLAVETKPRSEYLKITYTDPDPAVAAAAVRAVSNAYAEIYAADEQHIKEIRLKVLKQKETDALGRMKKTQASIDQAVQQFGSTDLGEIHEAAMRRVAELDSVLQDLRIALASAVAKQPNTSSIPSSPAGAGSPLSAEQIAGTNTLMQGYLQEQRRLEEQLETLHLRGYGDSFPDVALLKNSLEKAKARVTQYAAEYNSVLQATGRTPGDANGGAAALSSRSPAELRAEEAKLVELREQARQEWVRLETARQQLERSSEVLRHDREQLDRITQMTVALEDQDQLGGRLTVINFGEVPLTPLKDNRLKFAAAGGLAGMCLPAGLFALLGLLRPRYRYADETAAGISANVPLLAILPTLQGTGDRLEDLEQASAAAQHVHQVRMVLDVNRRASESTCYLVSSASPGEGKTSLTVALGLSFAASGSRTLVIDADLVGRQITHNIEADELPGLHEALATGTLTNSLRRTVTGLFVLPTGQANARHGCALSPTALQGLIAEARRHFETILIDSGPILGSVEASLLAQQADGVLLVMARGQQPSRIRGALRHLESLHAKVCGAIFNRAEARDFFQSAYTSSSRSSSSPGASDSLDLPRRRCRFGPLVKAVVASLPDSAIELAAV
jgi:succinoglycan biosynthesis transport protein ExoP